MFTKKNIVTNDIQEGKRLLTDLEENLIKRNLIEDYVNIKKKLLNSAEKRTTQFKMRQRSEQTPHQRRYREQINI